MSTSSQTQQHQRRRRQQQQPQHQRQIRATYDSDTITVYQAYNHSIALAAVSTQRLDASPLFHRTRMTWIKPSWNWTMYRSGYSGKDANQSHILALKLTHAFFWKLLRASVVTDDLRLHINRNSNINSGKKDENKVITDNDTNDKKKKSTSSSSSSSLSTQVRVQWDPERSVRANATLPLDAEGRSVRSIQIGVPGGLVAEMVEEGIVGIEDVTGRARRLKEYLDDVEIGSGETMEGEDELVEKGLLPRERVYDLLTGDIAALLGTTG